MRLGMGLGMGTGHVTASEFAANGWDERSEKRIQPPMQFGAGDRLEMVIEDNGCAFVLDGRYRAG